MSQQFKVSELIPYKDNDYFFDDIKGEAWQAFIDSIKTSGVIEPIIITQDKVIVSGHQRVRACKALGIDEIQGEVRIYDSEDELLKQLIETNIRQRGIGNPNPVKLGRCFKELERIYGIKQGNNQHDRTSNNFKSSEKSQEDIAEEFGLTVQTIHNYKQLADMIPEMQDLIETGIVTPTTARAIIKQLPEFQQKELAEQLSDNDGKVSKREVQKYIDKIRELESRDPEVKTVVREVIPSDYKEAKNKAKAYDAETRRLNKRLEDAYKERNYLQDRVAELEGATKEGLDTSNLSENVFYFCTICNNFIGNVGGLVWLTDRIADMPEKQRDMFLKASNSFRDWSLAFTQNLERRVNEYEQTAEFDSRVPVLTDKESRRQD